MYIFSGCHPETARTEKNLRNKSKKKNMDYASQFEGIFPLGTYDILKTIQHTTLNVTIWSAFGRCFFIVGHNVLI